MYGKISKQGVEKLEDTYLDKLAGEIALQLGHPCHHLLHILLLLLCSDGLVEGGGGGGVLAGMAQGMMMRMMAMIMIWFVDEHCVDQEK